MRKGYKVTEKTVEIKLIASDQASGPMRQVQRITQEAGAVMERTSSHSSKLQRQWENLTSASEYLAGGIKKVKNILEGVLWGTIIGAVTALAFKFIDYVTQSRMSEEATKQLSEAVRNQAEAWKLLPDKIEAVSKASIDLYNAQLRQAQFLGRNKGRELSEQIEAQIEKVTRLREVVRQSQKFAWPLDKSVVESIAASEVKIAGLRKEQENWQRLMEMVPATLSGVKNNLSETGAAAEKFHESLLKQAQDMELQVIRLKDGEGAYLNTLRERLLLQTKDVAVVDRLISAMRELNTLQTLSQIKHTEPKFEPMVNVPQLNLSDAEVESLQRRVTLMDEYNRLQAQSVSGIYDRITAAAALGDITAQEQQAMLLSIETIKVRNALFAAGVSAVQQAILGQQQLGKALKAALAQTMAQVAAESAVRAIFEAAMGFANLWRNPAASAAHFKAAGLFAAVGVAAGIAARGIAGNAAKNQTSSSSSGTSSNPVATFQPQPQPQNVNIHVYGNIVDHAAFVRELQPYFREVAVDTV